ncbi:glycosyltransferase family 2 protein [Opitutus terrae]|uniref:Glycosyl transferase family 2 n=1 Tax=Opitutus terrae (strain DSM 11246 / JCM 15787 / PB90-1) TaxID=452637 RepID=B1ZVC6_OPITP|nr:glycosyltransferase family 2 protein [Opitutus terrae]ACB76793.1 glycosyl transferase family 2 [Opitutus terrae PB90-1]
MTPRFSLVVPLYNEAGNVLPLLAAANDVLATFRGGHEIILVDDGSTDATPADIAAACARWPTVRSIRHPQNQGQAAALLTGLHAARGELILTMDGDGQNDPHDFPKLLAPVEAGALDLACGWRVDRHDSWTRRVISRVGNAVRRVVLGDHLHDGGCQLRVFRREIIAALFPVDLLQSFLPAIAVALGFRVGEFPVRHHARRRGRAKFGLRKLWWRPFVAMLAVRRRTRTT